MRIGKRIIGADQPVFVVAELSANHRGSLTEALQLVEAAAHAGADAVKLQTYTPDTMTLDSDQEWFLVPPGTPWSGQPLYDLYREAQTPWEWHAELQAAAHERDMEFFSSPFDRRAVEFLEGLEVPAYKIASFELVDLELVAATAATGKTLIMSTGMATLDEIGRAVDTAREHGAKNIALLKCTSSYPADPADANLRSIPVLRERFGTEVGLSDHSLGSTVAVAAVALGATIVEKHLTVSRQAGGPDGSFSMEVTEFIDMVNSVRTAKEALGSARFQPTDSEAPSVAMRRSLFVVEDVLPGDKLTRANVRSLRPGMGLEPRFLPSVLGRTVGQSVRRGTPLRWDMLKPRQSSDGQ